VFPNKWSRPLERVEKLLRTPTVFWKQNNLQPKMIYEWNQSEWEFASIVAWNDDRLAKPIKVVGHIISIRKPSALRKKRWKTANTKLFGQDFAAMHAKGKASRTFRTFCRLSTNFHFRSATQTPACSCPRRSRGVSRWCCARPTCNQPLVTSWSRYLGQGHWSRSPGKRERCLLITVNKSYFLRQLVR